MPFWGTKLTSVDSANGGRTVVVALTSAETMYLVTMGSPPRDGWPQIRAGPQSVQLRRADVGGQRWQPKEQAMQQRSKGTLLAAGRGEEDGVVVELHDVAQQEDELEADRGGDEVLGPGQVLR